MQEGFVTSQDGTRLFSRRLGDENAARRVLMIHGFGEHSGRYVELMEALNARGIASFAIDLRGHGRSTGVRGMIYRLDEYLDDVSAAKAALGHGQNTFLFGHSLGGLIGLHHAASSAYRAQVIASPYLGRSLKVPKIKLIVGRALGRIAPKLAIAAGITGEMLTHDPREAAAYERDPYLITKVRTGWFRAVEAAMAEAPSKAALVHAPTLWFHGESDPVASFPVSQQVFQSLASKDKTFMPLAGMRHEPLHEIERARVIQLVVEFFASK
jgi:acylglycerol lipase